MKKLLTATALSAALANPLAAGGYVEPVLEPAVIVEDTSSSAGGILVPLLAIGMCLFLMSHLQAVTWIAFAVWVVIGLLVYFGYARRRSLLHTPQQGVVPASETAR